MFHKLIKTPLSSRHNCVADFDYYFFVFYWSIAHTLNLISENIVTLNSHSNTDSSIFMKKGGIFLTKIIPLLKQYERCVSNNVNEVIRAVLNFFTKRYTHTHTHTHTHRFQPHKKLVKIQIKRIGAIFSNKKI